jgi:hypothetical protein
MHQGERIPGITKSALWNAWKAVRSQLKKAPRRDVLDYLEYDIDPDVWINRLLRRLKIGEYTPEKPIRYSLAKSKGFDRIITVPRVPDLVLYRTIVDHLFRKARRKQKKHVYFSRATLSKAVAAIGQQTTAVMQAAQDRESSDYETTSTNAFLEWLKFDQYRKFLIFDKIHPFIVVTDIANFFDSVLYGRIEESLYDIPAPSKMVLLLFSLLENLSIREEFTLVQRIGLPVDPCDCSRNLAHMALFPHDERMTNLVGEDAYVRWMDDQNIAADSYAHGLRILAAVGDSLRRLHLTPNVGKSRILSLSDAKVHFHFDANQRLDQLEKAALDTPAEKKVAEQLFLDAWNAALMYEGDGEWHKVLKRFYRHAARIGTRLLVTRAAEDIKRFPDLVDRVTDYMRYVGTSSECIDFACSLLDDEEQVYSDVNYRLIEALLKLEPSHREMRRLRKLAQKIINDEINFRGAEDSKVLAPLLLLRYGDRRNINGMATKLRNHGDTLPTELCRSFCAVVSSDGDRGFADVQSTASKLLRNHISDFVRLVLRIKKFTIVPGRFKARIKTTRDSITGAKFVDMRSYLAVRILALCPNEPIQDWITSCKAGLFSESISIFEKELINKLWPKARGRKMRRRLP